MVRGGKRTGSGCLTFENTITEFVEVIKSTLTKKQELITMFRGDAFRSWVDQRIYDWKTQEGLDDVLCKSILTYLMNNSIQSTFDIRHVFRENTLSKYNELKQYRRYKIYHFCNVAKGASHGKNIVAYEKDNNVHKYSIFFRTINTKTKSFWYESFLYCQEGYIEKGLARKKSRVTSEIQ